MNWVELVREIIGVYRDSYMESVNVLCFDIYKAVMYTL